MIDTQTRTDYELDKQYTARCLAFERAVGLLQNNLQRLANAGKCGQKYIDMQNGIIKALIDYQHHAELWISELEMDIMAFVKVNSQDKIRTSLEAICLIHGISDFPIWMERDKNYLVYQAEELQAEGLITLPLRLQERLSKLPKEKRDAVHEILNEGRDLSVYERLYESKRNGVRLFDENSDETVRNGYVDKHLKFMKTKQWIPKHNGETQEHRIDNKADAEI